MTYPEPPDGSEPVLVTASPEAAALDEVNEPTNVFRVAALSAMIGDDPLPVEGLQAELTQLGFSPTPGLRRAGHWRHRAGGRFRAIPRLPRGTRGRPG